ncbi:uncharacterized protein VTP21DRAFT_7511 [Calcarisporiella thermophila]|uniref:uncharacterized protein n=1 Tax=Calcarisporiella thermophila TaxID=911321 RepID=UPI00374346B2
MTLRLNLRFHLSSLASFHLRSPARPEKSRGKSITGGMCWEFDKRAGQLSPISGDVAGVSNAATLLANGSAAIVPIGHLVTLLYSMINAKWTQDRG